MEKEKIFGAQHAAPENDERASMFKFLYNMNVNDKTEKKNGLTYLSWAWAWAKFKQMYPTATYKIIKNPATNLPYFSDAETGIMCYTEVTVDDLTYEMWLPVMDSANNAMKTTPYALQTWSSKYNKYIEKQVAAATMFDINKTIMRCLVKNLAMFGLGLYIYAGEDLPEDLENEKQEAAPAQKAKRTTAKTQQPAAPVAPAAQMAPVAPMMPVSLAILPNDPYAGIKQILANLQSVDEMMALYNERKDEVEGNPEIKALFGLRKKEIKSNIA